MRQNTRIAHPRPRHLQRWWGVTLCLIAISLSGATWSAAAGINVEPSATGKTDAKAVDASDQARLAETWGVEISSIRLTAHGHMIDYRYRVLDADKAAELFKRQIKPYLIHQASGKVLAVPDTAKLGPLRNSNTPQEGRIYWMFFSNARDLVQHGDQATVVIGDFRVENLVVE
jgi:hypothetical protein